jgi:septal ring factor EnvC (AmiA/AmiB activator)
MAFTLTEAARAIGRNRTTVFRAIKAGKLSAIRDEITGEWLIEAAELFRAYSVAPGATDMADNEMARNGDSTDCSDGAMTRKAEAPEQIDGTTGELRELRARFEAAEMRIAEKDDTIADLRRRLDAENEERRQAQARVMALLTDQSKPRRRWWHFGGRG